MSSDPMTHPAFDDLKCLSTWPAGSVGEVKELMLISNLLDLCRQHGYGNVSQTAQSIEDIWRDPTKLAGHRRSKTAHLRFMERCKKEIAAEQAKKGGKQ